jgi:hypothetical protein
MAIAHACTSCGPSLAGIPAPLDPVYHLPIVVCPECHAAAVRWSDGHRLMPRTLNRIRLAIATAMNNTAWPVIAAIAVAVGTILMADDLGRRQLSVWRLLGMFTYILPRDDRLDDWYQSDGPISLVIWLCISTLAGAFLTGGLPHLRRRVFVPVFIVMVVVFLFVPGTGELLDQLANGRMRGLAIDRLSTHYRHELRALAALPASGLVALVGIPIGLRLRRIGNAIRARGWRRLRNRIKKRRHGP